MSAPPLPIVLVWENYLPCGVPPIYPAPQAVANLAISPTSILLSSSLSSTLLRSPTLSRGSFGDLSDKDNYYHLEPLNQLDASVRGWCHLCGHTLGVAVCSKMNSWIMMASLTAHVILNRQIMLIWNLHYHYNDHEHTEGYRSILWVIMCTSDYQSLSGNCVCISLQLNQPHALYLDSEHSQQEGTCGECAWINLFSFLMATALSHPL